MKRFISSITALLIASLLLVGCSAEVESSQIDTSQIESVEESSRAESVEESSRVESVESSEIVDESSTPEEEESVDDKFAGIASFDTEFNEANVIYYDGYMDYTTKDTAFPPFLELMLSTDKFAAYDTAEDDDWFVVALSLPNGRETQEYAEFYQMLEHIGAIEIADHPFLGFVDYHIALSEAKTDAEKDAIKKKRYEEMFPNAEYGKDCFYVGAPYNYIGYFTKPMLREFDMATDTYIPYTFMPEIGNNDCWFKNMRLK